jgi:hypothetical protein
MERVSFIRTEEADDLIEEEKGKKKKLINPIIDRLA